MIGRRALVLFPLFGIGCSSRRKPAQRVPTTVAWAPIGSEWCRFFFSKVSIVSPPFEIDGVLDGQMLTPKELLAKANAHLQKGFDRYGFALDRGAYREMINSISQTGSQADLVVVLLPNEESHDLIGEAARFDNPLEAPTNVIEVVRYGVFRLPFEAVTEVPPSLARIVVGLFELLREHGKFTPQGETNLADTTLKSSVAPTESRTLFCATETSGGGFVIRLSPLLLRSTLLLSAGTQFIYFNGSRSLDYRTQERIAQSIVETFKKQVVFPLAHEMAHVFLGELIGTNDAEERCDRAAAELIREAGLTFSPGIFQTLMVAAINEGVPEVWEGIRDADAIRKRLAQLTA
jgi:hypothetical protein